MKPLEPASLITKESGVIILAGKCTSCFPGKYLETCSDFIKRNRDCLKDSLFNCFDNNERIITDGAPELNMSLAQVILALQSFKVILFSREVTPEDVEKLGFIHASTLDEALRISRQYLKMPSVNIVPSGGVIIPELD